MFETVRVGDRHKRLVTNITVAATSVLPYAEPFTDIIKLVKRCSPCARLSSRRWPGINCCLDNYFKSLYCFCFTNLPIRYYFDSSFFQFSPTFLISTRSDERSKNDKTPNKADLTRTLGSLIREQPCWSVTI